LIIAFRPEQGLGRGQGRASATTRLEAIGWRSVDLPDSAFELALEVAVDLTANLSPGFGGGLACKGAQGGASKKEGEPRRQIRTLVARRSRALSPVRQENQ
jgi:hypothetical protein